MIVYPLDETRPLPFAPGSGPFKVKGDTYRGHLLYVQEHVPGGIATMNAGFKDPRLAPFFEQRFLPSSQYDIIPLVTAGYVCARACHMSFTEFIRMRSQQQAKRDLNGLYRMLMKLTSPTTVVKRLPLLLAQYVNFIGPIDIKVIEPRHYELSGGQMPAMLASWFAPINETYFDSMMKAAGAKVVMVRNHPLEPDGMAHGFETVRMRYDVSWTE